MEDSELHARLVEWAEAYAGDQFRRLGYSSTERLAETASAPTLVHRSRADEIETIVHAMEQSGRWKEVRVLRAEYFLGALSATERIQRLSSIGLPISRTSYHVFLEAARAFVCGALSNRLVA